MMIALIAALTDCDKYLFVSGFAIGALVGVVLTRLMVKE